MLSKSRYTATRGVPGSVTVTSYHLPPRLRTDRDSSVMSAISPQSRSKLSDFPVMSRAMTTPAGWYPDPDGSAANAIQRRVLDRAPLPRRRSAGDPVAPAPTARSPVRTKVLIGIGAAVVVLIGVVVAAVILTMTTKTGEDSVTHKPAEASGTSAPASESRNRRRSRRPRRPVLVKRCATATSPSSSGHRACRRRRRHRVPRNPEDGSRRIRHRQDDSHQRRR